MHVMIVMMSWATFVQPVLHYTPCTGALCHLIHASHHMALPADKSPACR